MPGVPQHSSPADQNPAVHFADGVVWGPLPSSSLTAGWRCVGALQVMMGRFATPAIDQATVSPRAHRQPASDIEGYRARCELPAGSAERSLFDEAIGDGSEIGFVRMTIGSTLTARAGPDSVRTRT